MPKLDRYLFREFTRSFLATLIILLMVSVGGVMADLLGDVADGKVPARLLLSQLGLQFLNYMPYIIPLALMLGLLLAFSRLYRDSEMAVLTAAGIGPRRLLRPLMMLVVPVVIVVAACSLWLGPWALRTAHQMLDHANRSLVVSGLDAGKFTVLSSGAVVYVSALSPDGTGLSKVFMHRSKDGRIDVVTAKAGQMFFEGERNRYLRLDDGFRVEAYDAADVGRGPVATLAAPGFTVPFLLHSAWMPRAVPASGDVERLRFTDELDRIGELDDDLADAVREVARDLEEGVPLD